MPVFEYEVVDRAGAVGRGRQQAETQEDLIQQLRDRGQLVVALRPSDGPPRSSVGDIVTRRIRNLRGRVRLSTLVLFTGQLAAMLEAGIHLVRILSSLARESDNKRFAVVVDDVRDSISGGMAFADALARYPAIFSGLYVAVVRAGEISGALHVVLGSLTVHLEKAEKLRRKVKGAFAYPVGILTVALLIVFSMIVWIVPIFEGIYSKANARLPAPTLVLIGMSHAVRDYTVVAFLAIVVLGVTATRAVRTDRGRDLIDALKLRLPVFGTLLRKAVVARTCRTLGLLLQNGIPLIEALTITARVAENRTVERALVSATRGVRDGGTLAEMMRQTGVFPSLVIQLVATGEESGSLAVMLGKAAQYYEAQVDAAVETLSTLIEPMMIVTMGAIAGSVIFALYMPIFNLGQAIREGIK
jgi:type IV pilus assembly protein PilC